VTAGTTAGIEEHLLAGRSVARGAPQRAGPAGQALDIADQPPDAVGGQPGKRRHLRARHAAANGLEQITVAAAMPEGAGIESGSALAAGRPGSVAGGTGGLEHRLA